MRKSWENNGKDHGKIVGRSWRFLLVDATRHGDEKKTPEIMGRSWGDRGIFCGTYSLRRILMSV